MNWAISKGKISRIETEQPYLESYSIMLLKSQIVFCLSEEYYSARAGCERKLEISESCGASRSCSGDDFVSIEHGGFIGSSAGRKSGRKRPARQRGPVGYNTQAYNGISIGRDDDMQLLWRAPPIYRLSLPSCGARLAVFVYVHRGCKSFQNTLLQRQAWLSRSCHSLWFIVDNLNAILPFKHSPLLVFSPGALLALLLCATPPKLKHNNQQENWQCRCRQNPIMIGGFGDKFGW